MHVFAREGPIIDHSRTYRDEVCEPFRAILDSVLDKHPPILHQLPMEQQVPRWQKEFQRKRLLKQLEYIIFLNECDGDDKEDMQELIVAVDNVLRRQKDRQKTSQ